MILIISDILKTVFAPIGLAVLISTPFILLWQWGKKAAQRANEYEALYSEIEIMIDDKNRPIDLVNYKTIDDKLISLYKLKHKERERTSVLTANFARKYDDIIKQRVRHDVSELITM